MVRCAPSVFGTLVRVLDSRLRGNDGNWGNLVCDYRIRVCG